MRSSSRSLVILLCLFLISFKVTAGSIFIDAAIERAQMHQTATVGHTYLEVNTNTPSPSGEQQSHTLFLMSHVTANISDTNILIPFYSTEVMVFSYSNEILYTQNIPDSAFKPPKLTS